MAANGPAVRGGRADVLVRVNPQSFVAYSGHDRRISLFPRLRTLSRAGRFGEWLVVLHGQGSACDIRPDSLVSENCQTLKSRYPKLDGELPRRISWAFSGPP